MSFKKGSLAVALLLVALMTFGGCGGGGGGDGPGPGPDPGSNIDGTWKVSTISYGGSPLAVTSTPSTFPVRMIYDGGKYTANVNNGTDVLCEDAAGGRFTVPTVDNLTRIGSSERYESSSGILELIGDELVVTVTGATITFARATGPGPGPDPDPDPDPDPSAIDGTWKFTEVTHISRNENWTRIPDSLQPETFPLKVTPNAYGRSTYTIDVNNGRDALWFIGSSFGQLYTRDWDKVGDEKYEYTDTIGGTDLPYTMTFELTGTNTLTQTFRAWESGDMQIITLTRQ